MDPRIAHIMNDRIFTREGESFTLNNHPSLKGDYRWIAHGVRMRLKKGTIFGVHDELIDVLEGNSLSLFGEDVTYRDKCREFVKLVDLPSTATPVLYIEVHGIFAENFDVGNAISSAQSRVNNWSKSIKHCHVRLKGLTVQNGLLKNPSNTIKPRPKAWTKRWRSFWMPHAPPPNNEELRIDVGQANGAHTYGWLDRGGHALRLKGSNDLDFHASRVTTSTKPPIFEDMSLSRAGFLLYELQKKTLEGWKEVRQDDDNDINPLSIPIILDYSEKYLITYCQKVAWAKKNDSKNTGSGSYPLRTYAWKRNHYSHEFKVDSNLGKDMQEIQDQLKLFIEDKSQLLDNDIPEFGEVLDRGEWLP